MSKVGWIGLNGVGGWMNGKGAGFLIYRPSMASCNTSIYFNKQCLRKNVIPTTLYSLL